MLRVIQKIYGLLSDNYLQALPPYMATPEQAVQLVFQQMKQRQPEKKKQVMQKPLFLEQCSSNLQHLQEVQHQWHLQYEQSIQGHNSEKDAENAQRAPAQ